MRLCLAAAAILVGVLAMSRPAHAGGGFLIPPMRVDVGPTTTTDHAGHRLGGGEILAGIHWASVYPKSTPIDIGVGFVSTYLDLPELPGNGVALRSAESVDDDRAFRLTGGYVALSKSVAGGSWWRTWAEGRGELFSTELDGNTSSGLGGALRVSAEVFIGGTEGGSNALICGTLAAGLFVEASYRELPTLISPLGVSAGVSVRIPLIIAVD